MGAWIVLGWIVVAGIVYADARGRDWGGPTKFGRGSWTVATLLVGVFALPFYFRARRHTTNLSTRCPHCLSRVRPGATVCPHCTRAIQPAE